MKKLNVLICAGGGGTALSRSSCAFTMAEILLSLTIIGVVAAITLPSLTGNINERTWNTQRKALYARFSQAIALMPSLNGYGTLTEAVSASGETPAKEAVDTAAETFVTEGLAKVLKINNICDSQHLADCGITNKLTTSNGSVISFPTDWKELNTSMVSASYDVWSHSMINAKAAAFETQNGESVAVFYNPTCSSRPLGTNGYMVSPLVCVNFVYDLNGSKGPNTYGKDIGSIVALYSSDSQVVAPVVSNIGSTALDYNAATLYCRSLGDSRLTTREEAMALSVNRSLVGGIGTMVTTTIVNSNGTVHIDPNCAMVGYLPKSRTIKPVCVKR